MITLNKINQTYFIIIVLAAIITILFSCIKRKKLTLTAC